MMEWFRRLQHNSKQGQGQGQGPWAGAWADAQGPG